MDKKTCCVTGHRDIPADKLDYVTTRLQEEIEAAIADGYTAFLSGFAEGVDLLFAELVIKQKKRYPLYLEAAIPYQGRLRCTNSLFRKCLVACDAVQVQQVAYSGGCFLNRNRYMVTQSDRVIAVYDGREKGGTLFTMRYAHTLGRELREISI